VKLKEVMFALALIFVASGQADDKPLEGEKLITPPLWAHSPDMFACNLTNVDRTTRTVQVRIISNAKVLLESEKIALEPRHTTNHKVSGFAEGGPIYCEFTVEGPKTMYRGAAKLFPPPNGTDITAIAAE
jgi:hypothetical protein